MDEDDAKQLRNDILGITQRLFEMDGVLAELKASVNVLKVLAANAMNPDDFLKALQALHQMEGDLHDANFAEREKALRIIDALRKKIKAGGESDS